MTHSRRHLLGLIPILGLASCTTPTPPPSGPAPTSPTVFVTPTSGDWQTGRPESGTSTAAPTSAAPSLSAPPGSTLPPGRAGIPRGQATPDAKVNRKDATAAATAFAARLAENDSRLDNRPQDAAKRAAVYATQALNAALTKNDAPVAGVGSAFLELQQHDGYTIVTTAVGGLGQTPPDTATAAVRAVTTTAAGRNDNGWTSSTTTTTTWLVSLTRDKNGTWAVDQYRIG